MPIRADAARTRLMVRIARMYHELGKRQTEIAAELHVSQPRVSRLLKRAVEEGIVRTVVTAPEGTHLGLEEGLEERFGLTECIVVDSGKADAEIDAALSSAAATYLETTLTGGDVIGLSSWSATWLAAIEQSPVFRTCVATRVVQLFGGGVGHPRGPGQGDPPHRPAGPGDGRRAGLLPLPGGPRVGCRGGAAHEGPGGRAGHDAPADGHDRAHGHREPGALGPAARVGEYDDGGGRGRAEGGGRRLLHGADPPLSIDGVARSGGRSSPLSRRGARLTLAP